MSNFSTKPIWLKGIKYFAAAGLCALFSANALAQSTSITGPVTGQISAAYIVAGSTHQISVKADYTAQTYKNVAGNITGTGLQFGVTQNTDAPSPVSQSAWVGMSNVSDPANELFRTNTASIESFDVKGNSALSMFSATRPLAAAGLSTRGRYLMGQVTLTFSEPVDNPVLQLVGLGGSITNGTTLGFTTELEMVSPDLSLTKLSGNTNLKVNDRYILNAAERPNALSNSGAASGSVLVSGQHIGSLVFNIYMRGDGSGAGWENIGTYVGDRWLMGFSFNEPIVAAVATAKETKPIVLPIYVTKFNVSQQEGCGVAIRWNTSTELGINGFGIEHSVNGIDFEQVAYIESDGNASGDHYSYSFAGANNGANYFRIHIDNSASQDAYTAIIPLKLKCGSGSIQVQPNPTPGVLHVKGFAPGNTLSLFNMTGRQVQSQTLNTSETSIDMSELKEGIYMLIIKNERGEELEKVRVQKM